MAKRQWQVYLRLISFFNCAREYGLPEPKVQEFDNMFRVELFRNISSSRIESNFVKKTEWNRRKFGENSERVWNNELNDIQKKIINILSVDARLPAAKISDELCISSRSVEKNIGKLKEYGILVRHGSPRNGYWEITQKYEQS